MREPRFRTGQEVTFTGDAQVLVSFLSFDDRNVAITQRHIARRTPVVVESVSQANRDAMPTYFLRFRDGYVDGLDAIPMNIPESLLLPARRNDVVLELSDA